MTRSRRSLTWLAAAVAIAFALLVIAAGESRRPVPVALAQAGTPQELAAQLTGNDAVLREAIDRWREAEDPPTQPPPDEVLNGSRFLQDQVRALARDRALAASTIPLLPDPLRSAVVDLVAASRKLARLSKGAPERKLKEGEPESLGGLVSHYRKAKRRHRIGVHYLAAVNLVETKFGRVKSKSTAGAKGPMQFIPSTWKIYGKGSIHDPHDAIQAAARLLRDRGAPRSYGRALFAYNPSKLYVGAVSIYARLIARDRDAIYFLYCWGP